MKSCTTLFWGRAERLPYFIENNTLIEVPKAPAVKDNAVELVRKSYSQPLTVKWVKDRNDGSQNMTSDLDTSVNLRPGDDPVIYSFTILTPTDVGGTLVVDVKFNEVLTCFFYSKVNFLNEEVFCFLEPNQFYCYRMSCARYC